MYRAPSSGSSGYGLLTLLALVLGAMYLTGCADTGIAPGGDSQAEAKPPPRDIILHETQRILLDYLSLLDHGGTLQARRADPVNAQEVRTR